MLDKLLAAYLASDVERGDGLEAFKMLLQPAPRRYMRAADVTYRLGDCSGMTVDMYYNAR